MSYVKKQIDGVLQEFWLKDKLDETNANYRIAFSQRGPGKSYQIKCEAIDRWLKNGKQFVTPLLENGQFILDAIGEERTKLRIK